MSSLPASVAREVAADIKAFIGPARAKGKKRKTNNAVATAAAPAAHVPDAKLELEAPDSEEEMLRALSAPSLALLIEKCNTTLVELEAERDAIAQRMFATADQLRTAQRESNFRILDAMQARIDLTRPTRPVLVKFIALLRKYGELFDRRICRVTYGASVTCDMVTTHHDEELEITRDGDVMGDRGHVCNLMSDPRTWEL